MVLIFVVIAFVGLSSRFFPLATGIGWCFEKVLAFAFFAFAILSLFAYVVIDGVVFLFLPIAFLLVAIDTLGARSCSKPMN
jgi:hypothetical protein